MSKKSDGVLSPLRVGNNVFIRTVTNYFTGRIELLNKDEIVLSCAAWIGDTGRFANALKGGTLNEIEPYPGVVSVARAAIVDVSDWAHALPTVQE